MLSHFSLQPMESPAGGVHILGLARIIEHRQLKTETTGVLWLNACQRSGPKELLEALVLEGPDHSCSVSHADTGGNRGERERGELADFFGGAAAGEEGADEVFDTGENFLEGEVGGVDDHRIAGGLQG
jgi:hypothetical protein